RGVEVTDSAIGGEPSSPPALRKQEKGGLVSGCAFFIARPDGLRTQREKKKARTKRAKQRLPPMPLERGHRSVGVFWPPTNRLIFPAITCERIDIWWTQLHPGGF
ncbi:MAG TPA: hypothetical protein VGJ10_11685, partial [Paraburkholderia sp.]